MPANIDLLNEERSSCIPHYLTDPTDWTDRRYQRASIRLRKTETVVMSLIVNVEHDYLSYR